MKCLSKSLVALSVVVVLSGAAQAANTLAAGTVKSVDAEKKEFVLTDAKGEDWTIQLAEEVVINRGGKEAPTGLKAGDAISVCYEKGLRSRTAHYILVKEADTSDHQLMLGTLKTFDADEKRVVYTDADGKDHAFALGESRIRLNMQPGKLDSARIGDEVLMIVQEQNGKRTLKEVMVRQKK